MATPEYKFGDIVTWKDPSNILRAETRVMIVSRQPRAWSDLSVFFLTETTLGGSVHGRWSSSSFVPVPNKNRTL